MPARLIRDGILSSDRINRLGWAEEVFYRRLMSVVDDYGRFSAHHSLIRAACYPLKLDKVSDSDVGKWLTACVNAALVRVYPASDGKRYLELLDFGQRIQSKSKYPAPADDPPRSTVENGDSRLDTVENRLVGVEDVVVDEGVKRPRKRGTSPKTSLPEAFGIADAVRKWAEAKGYGSLDEHLEAFKRKALAKDYRYANWDAAFQEAIREDWAKLRQGATTTPQARQRVDL